MLTFIETRLFTRLVQNYFTDDEYAELLTLYSKNEAERIRGAILKKIKDELDGKD